MFLAFSSSVAGVNPLGLIVSSSSPPPPFPFALTLFVFFFFFSTHPIHAFTAAALSTYSRFF